MEFGSFENSETQSVSEVEKPLFIDLENGFIEIEGKYAEYLPQELEENPIDYFKKYGEPIKQGDVIIDAQGRVREDPTATRYLPSWYGAQSEEIELVGKLVNTQKQQVLKKANAFYEYEVIEKVRALGLPAAVPVLKAAQGGEYLFITERAPGFTSKQLKDLLREDFYKKFEQSAKISISQLQKKFETAGVDRKWDWKDMIFDVDLETGNVRAVTPVDWEKTKIDEVKYNDTLANLVGQ